MSRLLFLSALGLAAVAVEQPIPYSHKTHIKLGLKCAECHTMPGKGEAATFPPEAKCMVCHAQVKRDSPPVRLLARYFTEKKPVPWKQVYRLPNYVWFSHKRHARTSCETCHGPVAERDAIVKEMSISMVACMECHERAGALNECNTCHNP